MPTMPGRGAKFLHRHYRTFTLDILTMAIAPFTNVLMPFAAIESTSTAELSTSTTVFAPSILALTIVPLTIIFVPLAAIEATTAAEFPTTDVATAGFDHVAKILVLRIEYLIVTFVAARILTEHVI